MREVPNQKIVSSDIFSDILTIYEMYFSELGQYLNIEEDFSVEEDPFSSFYHKVISTVDIAKEHIEEYTTFSLQASEILFHIIGEPPMGELR